MTLVNLNFEQTFIITMYSFISTWTNIQLSKQKVKNSASTYTSQDLTWQKLLLVTQVVTLTNPFPHGNKFTSHKLNELLDKQV